MTTIREGIFASVIIPTRGRPARLARALSSLLAQDLSAWEAIVVDDGEGDGIRAAETLQDGRIRALPSIGIGQVDARSTGIANARGSYICWLDDDDWWDDTSHLSLLARHATRDAFFFRGGWIVEEPESGGGLESREPFDLDASAESLRDNNTILTSSIAYPREAHRRVGLLDRSLGGYCDWDLMLRMCDVGILPRKIPGPSVCYAVHSSNESAAYDAPARRVGFERFRAKHGLSAQLSNHVLIHKMLS